MIYKFDEEVIFVRLKGLNTLKHLAFGILLFERALPVSFSSNLISFPVEGESCELH